MKKITFFAAAMFALAANAEVYTLDLTTATNQAGTSVDYTTSDSFVYNGNLKDTWIGTLSDATDDSFILANNGKFRFAHSAIPSYQSWSGFTISKQAGDSLSQFTCAAKGGTAGVGTPFLVGYYSEYGTLSTKMSFDGEYQPNEIQVCQSGYTLSSIKNGDSYAKKFTENDTLSLIIAGYDSNDNETGSVTYYLAVDGVFNEAWDKVDLSQIGACVGLTFRMTSTDTGKWGMNTPAYFAIDGLKISDVQTALHSVNASNLAVYTHNGYIEVENANAPIEIYTLQGYRLLSTTETTISTETLPAGIYVLKCGNEAVKIVK